MGSQRGRQGPGRAAAAALGISPAAELSLLGSQMPTSNRSACHPCSNRVSVTSRTAVYGPVRTVVWEGGSCKATPYPDHELLSDASEPDQRKTVAPVPTTRGKADVLRAGWSLLTLTHR